MLSRDRQSGFTLVELLVSIAVLGIVMSAIATALLVAMKSTAATATTLGESGDLQVAEAYFANDVGGANSMANTGPPHCGAGTLVIELSGPDFDPATLTPQSRVISYVATTTATPGGSSVTELHRLACVGAGSAAAPLIPSEDVKIADELSEAAPPVAVCTDAAGTLGCSDVSTAATLTMTSDSGEQFAISGTRETSS